MAWAGALAPGSRGCCSLEAVDLADRLRGAVAEAGDRGRTSARTGSNTSRAASPQDLLGELEGTDSAMPPAAAASNWCSAAW